MPVDWLVAAYNGVLAVVWLFAIGRAAAAPWLGATHLAAMTMPWLLARAPSRTSAPMQVLRDVYPLIWLAAFWLELDLVRPALALKGIDDPIAALDLAVFGVHLHEVWAPSMSATWFSELMHLLYFAYYPLIYIPPLVVILQKRFPALRDMVFRLMVAYLLCYVAYIPFPVDGPHFLQEHFQGPHTEGVFYKVVGLTQAAGDSRGCSFPSSHVAGAVSIAYLGWRWFPRWAAWLMTAEAVGVLLSTTYTQNHYAIDALAALLFALGLQVVVIGNVGRLTAPARRRSVKAAPVSALGSTATGIEGESAQ